MSRVIAGLSEIAGEFDGFLVDQFGVLHDGEAPFPGACACLEALKRLGKPVVALTNSGKRAAANADRLARLGFSRALFADVVSSGEVARILLSEWLAADRLKPGARVAVLSRDGDPGVIAGLGLVPVPPGQDAELLLIAGVEPERHSRAGYRTLLAGLASRAVPAVCANPDRVMYTPAGAAFGPGAVAEDYAAASTGAFVTVGKPGAALFDAGLRALGDPSPPRVLMIGDSPEHDVAGGARAGCATLLVHEGVQSSLSSPGMESDFSIGRLVW